MKKSTQTNQINKNIAAYRRLFGFTQADIAERLGMKTSTYSQMERIGNISAQRVVELAAILRISPIELINGPQTEMKSPNPVGPTVSGGGIIKGIETINPISLSPNEINLIKILRNLPKNAQNEIKDLINSKYKESKYKDIDK